MNELESSMLDSYQIWSTFNWEAIIGWALELHPGFTSNWFKFQLHINQRMSSRAPAWNHIEFDVFPITNQSTTNIRAPGQIHRAKTIEQEFEHFFFILHYICFFLQNRSSLSTMYVLGVCEHIYMYICLFVYIYNFF